MKLKARSQKLGVGLIVGCLTVLFLCLAASQAQAAKTGFCSFKCDNGTAVVGGATPDCDPNGMLDGYEDCATVCNTYCPTIGYKCGGKTEDVACVPSSVSAPTPSAGPTAPKTAPAKPSGGAQGVYGLYDPFAGATIPQIMGNVVKLLLGVVGTVFLVMFLWGGLTWMTAGGEPKKVTTAQNILKNAIFGIVAVIASYTVLSLIINLASLLQSK